MAMRYEWGFDVEQLVLDETAVAALAVYVDNGTNDGLVSITSGTFCHTDLSSVLGSGEYTALSTQVYTDLNTILSTLGWDAIAWDGDSYTLTYDNAGSLNASLDFRDAATPNGVGSGSSAGKMLAAALGFNYLHADATGGSASDPYNIVLSGQSEYVSNCRPYFLYTPKIPGRSNMSDEYEAENSVAEASADDGSAFYVARDGAALFSDWQQVAEDNSPPTTHPDLGGAVFKRAATVEIPWSLQHAWEHSRSVGSAPIFVVDGSELAVHELRADGLSFRPVRFAAPDYPLWSVAFKTRLLGRG